LPTVVKAAKIAEPSNGVVTVESIQNFCPIDPLFLTTSISRLSSLRNSLL
jgi:hypothetical protein